MNTPQVYMCSPSWTLLPPPSPFHPSGSSQCTSPKHPVLCIEPGLAAHFIHDILHVSMPFSQIFPPSPSPTESIRLFYTSVSLLKIWNASQICVSSLRSGHANLLCIVPILVYVLPKRALFFFFYGNLERVSGTRGVLCVSY